MKQFIRTMKALSEPNRVKILKVLSKKEMCVCELQSLLVLAQPTISKHLKVLEDAELVERFKENLWVNYRLYRDTPNPYARTLIQLLEGWLEDDPAVENLMSRADSVSRYQICARFISAAKEEGVSKRKISTLKEEV